MTIKYLIPAYLRPHAGGKTELSLEVQGATLTDALAALWRAHLGLRDRIIDEQGRPRQHINIFVNNDNSRDIGGFAAPIQDGDEIMIVPNISGGGFTPKRGKIAEAFGYFKGDLWHYRDTALGTIGAIASTIFLGVLFRKPADDFEWKMTLGALAIYIVCLLLTPNKITIIAFTLAVLILGGLRGVLLKGDERGYWILVPAIVAAYLFVKYCDTPLKRR